MMKGNNLDDGVFSNPETERLIPAQIDARHARHLLERALTQLERGERAQAALSCKQALHLAPYSTHAHSLAGLLALLDNDLDRAMIDYEKAVKNFEESSAERERFIALRRAQAARKQNQSPVDFAALLPNIDMEILRLRHMIQAAPLAEFLNESDSAAASTPPAPPSPPAPRPAFDPLDPLAVNPQFVRPVPVAGAVAPPRSAAFAAQMERRRRFSLIAVAAAGVLAALFGFLMVRTLRNGNDALTSTAPVQPVTTTTAQPVTPGVVITTPAVAPGAVSTPVAPVVAPTLPVATPRPVAPRPTPVPRPTSRPVVTTPRTPVAPRVLPTPIPTPRPTPAEPQFPSMPRPRVVLPGAGHAPPEYPRVLPAPREDYYPPRN